MDSILLTGSTGYLGRHLKRRLEGEGFDVIPFLRGSNPEDVVAQTHPSVIIHCATCYGRNNETESDIIEANFAMPSKLTTAAVKHGIQTFINTDTVLDAQINTYAASKKDFLKSLTSVNIPLRINLQFEQFFGPGDHDSKFPISLIRQLIANVISIKMTLGEQKRHFLFIDDAVDAYLHIIRKRHQLEAGFHHFQVSTENSISLKQFALLAKRLVGNTTTKLDFGAIAYRENELMDSITNITAMQQLGWTPKTSLTEAIMKTISEERDHEISH